MGFKDLLVHVDHGQGNASRVALALDLAERFAAHLTGVYIIPRWPIPPYAGLNIDPGVLESQLDAAQERAELAKAAFLAQVAASGFTGNVEWRALEGEPGPLLTQSARYADLTIVGQSDPDDAASADFQLAEKVIMESGRPVLLVPYIGVPNTSGKRALVAWNASRESVRAVNDALPLLRIAEHVDVIACNPDGNDAGGGGFVGADISLHLARHGVNAEAQHLKSDDVQVGDLLLSRAADLGADLIVMGGYGHSRWRELVLGGATRHILKHMTVPVLMSH